MSSKLLIGVIIFGASVFLVLGLLVSSGGANKSRQFEVLGDLMSGRHGALRRILLIFALGGLAVGALTSFAAVGGNDGARRQQCQNICVERGFQKGTMGLSASRNAAGKYNKVCRCSGGSKEDLEIDQSTLTE